MLSKIRLITDNLTPQLTQATVLAAIILLLSFAPAPADTLHATDDSYIDLVLTGENFGGNPNLVVQNVDIGRRGGENWTLVRFDLGTLPGGISSVDVDKASVRLWVSKVFVGGVVDVHVVTAPWDEGSVTGAPPPGFDPIPFVSVPIASADEGKFVTADVTGLVKDWLDGGGNFGVVLRPDAAGVSVQLDSKENSQTSHPPEIEVGLIGPEGPEGPQGEQGPAGSDATAVVAGQQCPEDHVIIGFDLQSQIICAPIAPPPPPPNLFTLVAGPFALTDSNPGHQNGTQIDCDPGPGGEPLFLCFSTQCEISNTVDFEITQCQCFGEFASMNVTTLNSGGTGEFTLTAQCTDTTP